ncbi:MAG: carboxylesterase family protein [Bdellovibrionota bacterium]
MRFTTKEGEVAGVMTKSGTFFENVPFAGPPVGPLRWKAPRPPMKRSQLWDGSRLQVKCAQLAGFFSGVKTGAELGQPFGSEDCLYLNVWVPRTTLSKLPVFVFLHGGSNRQGYASDPMYDGEELARLTQSIVVTINYRLGFFGAFYHRAMKSKDAVDSSGNFVTLDAIQALKWVRANIADLGGDTSRLTLGGQSAGCMNVWGLIQSPKAKGLFDQAYCSSGFPNSYPTSTAEARVDAVIEKALVLRGLARDLSQARSLKSTMSDEEIRKLLYGLSTNEVLKLTPGSFPVQHVADGEVLPSASLAVFGIGQYNAVPMMISTNFEEGSFFFLQHSLKLKNSEYWNMTTGQSSSLPLSDFIASPEYSGFAADRKQFTYGMNQLIDSILVSGELYMPAIYRMRWNWEPTREPWHSAFGAVHGLDLPLFFHKDKIPARHFFKFVEPELDAASMQRSEEFLGYLKGFLHRGDPNAFLVSGQRWNKWNMWFPSNLIIERGEIRKKNFYFDPIFGTYDLLQSVLKVYENQVEGT